MANLGIHVNEQATAVSTPVVANSGIPFVVGLAPGHCASNPAKANLPVLCTSWAEAVEKLGFSYDWGTYTLCEFMYSHFQLFGCQPVIFCNVLDPATMKKEVQAADHDVVDHKISLPFGIINDNSLVVRSGEDELERDTDYSVLYDEKKGVCIVELLSSSDHYSTQSLNVAGNTVTPDTVSDTDIVSGLGTIDACMNITGVIPDLICAPGFSHIPAVAAVMAAKAAGINGLFRAKALVDVFTGDNGVREVSGLLDWKTKNSMVDENQIVCWPMVKMGEYKFHLSTQMAGLMAQTDAGNNGCPYESPSNKALKIDGCCLLDGTEINLTWEQVQMIAGNYGIVTALNFMSIGWTLKGNYTACYPGNNDVKDYFIPVSRMFDWVANTLIRTYWSKLDKPMNRRLIDTVLDTCNIWLNGLVADERLLGARAEVPEDENPLDDLLAGILRIHIYLTPPSPAQEIDFTLEYSVDYATAALQSAG
ncbi:Phage tail sheath protein [Anaerotruncus colihominis]|mgnify:FL=1|uniref:Phage tail sheath protein n=1 Tax=Anaerotruncus colihominis TaxID=169435 RepID=A0A174TQB7_9FIRM|nr:phage tail protein [Anaerotruncus colihominis]CUQ11286.1 Phage tail sheath protein [Anaerotruncus colihominis]